MNEIAQRIDRDLYRIECDLLDVPLLEEDWEQARERGETWWELDWDGRELEWRDVVIRIEGLSRQYQNGNMSDEQAERYRAMIALLQEQTPALKRLQWWLPLIPIEFSLDVTE